MRFPVVIEPEELSALDPESIATRINSELERLILHRPDEAFWLHDRFRGAPEAAPGESPAESSGAR